MIMEDYNGENILPQTESVVEAELEAVAHSFSS